MSGGDACRNALVSSHLHELCFGLHRTQAGSNNKTEKPYILNPLTHASAHTSAELQQQRSRIINPCFLPSPSRSGCLSYPCGCDVVGAEFLYITWLGLWILGVSSVLPVWPSSLVRMGPEHRSYSPASPTAMRL